MRGLVFSLAFVAHATWASAFEVEDHAVFGDAESERILKIISTADISFFEPMIQSYLAANASVRVDYTVASSSEVMRALHSEQQA
ncbi:MAG: ABC transporter substrate-binding protein, partial [Pseudomonadota bacterium]